MKTPLLSPAQRHSAGAIVLHRSPFSRLRVPVTVSSERSVHRQAWLQSLYYQAPWEIRQKFLAEHRHEITATLVGSLLAEFDWRPRLAGSYLAAVAGLSAFRDQIGKLLLRSDVCFAARGYCLALASFNDARSADFLRIYLEYYLLHPELDFDQGYVLATLARLDHLNRTNLAQPYILIWHQDQARPMPSVAANDAHKIADELAQVRQFQLRA